MKVEYWKIKNCPICDDTHIYEIHIDRVVSMVSGPPEILELVHGEKADEVQSLTKKRKRRYNEIFFCPKEQETYKYSFDMIETRMTTIFTLKIGNPKTGITTSNILEIILDPSKKEEELSSYSSQLVEYKGIELPQSEVKVLEEFNVILHNSENPPLLLTSRHRSKVEIPPCSKHGGGIDDSRCFKSMDGHITEIKVNWRKCFSLPASIGNLKHLECISIVLADLGEFSESLGNLKTLKNLHLGNNRIQNIPEYFGNLEKLESLSIGTNFIRSLPSSLSKLSKLKKLHLSFNKLRDLPSSFKNLQSLERIDLEKNLFVSIPEPICNLINLKYIYADNSRDSIPTSKNEIDYYHSTKLYYIPESIGNLVNLVHLNLAGNLIHKLPSSMVNLKKLKILDLKDNPISPPSPEIIEWIKYLKQEGCRVIVPFQLEISETSVSDLELKIEVSTVSYHGTEVSKQEFDALRKLENIIGKPIPKTTESGKFGFQVENKHVVGLNLERMLPYTEINLPDIIGDLSFLKELCVRYTNLRTLPKTVGKFENLQFLNLHQNQIDFLPDEIGRLKLTGIIMSNNKLAYLPETFSNLNNLKVLSLEHNNLVFLPTEFGKLKNLETLLLRENQIQGFPESIVNLTSLKNLDFRKNQVRSPPDFVIQWLRNLKNNGCSLSY